MSGSVTLARPAARGAMPKTLGVATVFVAAGSFLLLVALRGDGLSFGTTKPLPLYCLGLLFIAALAWWEATRRRTGVLPTWTSPPALVAGWTLGWIYLPALAAFLDHDLLDDFTQAQGGEAVILAGLPLACGALAVLSLSYHLTTRVLGPRTSATEVAERYAPLQRVLGLYLLSTLARGVRLQTLGLAFGADRAGWGSLQSIDQWVGYVEDLRFLALALLVAHVIRTRSGYLWFALPIVVEVVLGATSGFIKPLIWPVVLCVATAAAFDRLRARHVLVVAATALVASTFVSVVAAIREDRMGLIGTSASDGLANAFAAPGRYWLNGVTSGDGAYDKFFGRQGEVASAVGLVRTLTPAIVPFEGVEKFLIIPAALIPRAVWPDKPTLSRGIWFSVTFRGLDEETTSASAMTIFSEGYLFYGWTGLVLSMLIVGAVLAVLRRSLDTPRLALAYLALLPTILEIEPEFSSYFTVIVQRSAVFFVVFVLVTYTRTVRFGHQRIRA